VLAGGDVVDCDADREPDLFWALRGAGGGQFGVVTELRFATVPQPVTVRVEAHVGEAKVQELVKAWQDWAPDAPDELTVNLTIDTEPLRATLFGASILDEGTIRELLVEFTELPVDVRAGLSYHQLKQTFEGVEQPGRRIRSEFFSRPMSGATLTALLAETNGPRQLAFTAMGGAYNRVAEDATAFAHRGERFLLEHAGRSVDRSWAIAHADGSGRVYPNFPDLALDDAPAAYHAGNLRRLTEIKAAYDPHRFFDFPQAI
jgi:FAD/FMN-containing dehydrogenase